MPSERRSLRRGARYASWADVVCFFAAVTLSNYRSRLGSPQPQGSVEYMGRRPSIAVCYCRACLRGEAATLFGPSAAALAL